MTRFKTWRGGVGTNERGDWALKLYTNILDWRGHVAGRDGDNADAPISDEKAQIIKKDNGIGVEFDMGLIKLRKDSRRRGFIRLKEGEEWKFNKFRRKQQGWWLFLFSLFFYLSTSLRVCIYFCACCVYISLLKFRPVLSYFSTRLYEDKNTFI